MPLYEYMCVKCKDTQEVFAPYEKVSLCECGGEVRRAYLTPPAMKIGGLKGGHYKTQGLDKKTGEQVICTTKHQVNEWGKRNEVIIEHE